MILLPQYKPLFYQTPQTRFFFVTGGRGSAKSYHVSTLLVNLSYEKNEVILFTRYTMASAHISIIPEFVEKIEELGRGADFIINKAEIINKHTGSVILFRGIKTSQGTQTANLKSIAGVTCWVLDEAEELHQEDVFDTINLSIRSKKRPNRVIMVMNPSHREHMLFKKFVKQPRPDTTYIHTTYKDNAGNLSESFLEEAARTKRNNLARYNHIFNGDWIDNVAGLLWQPEHIEAARLDPSAFSRNILTRIIVAIDPAVSQNKNSDETGIVVLGLDREKRVYLLEDLSGVYSPEGWATVAKEAADEWRADAYVAESNQGGDLVTSNLRTSDPQRRVKMVRATRGKYVRAEPIYGLYERGLVKHVGDFPKLEGQMLSFNPDENISSPDRVDALVWGCTDLIFANAAPTGSKMRGKSKHKQTRL